MHIFGFMIKQKDQILLHGVPVFTKIELETPVNEDLALPSDACYLHINEGDGHEMAKVPKVVALKGTTILSTCGITVGYMISENLRGAVDTTIVHFNSDVLKECFEGERPKLWEELNSPINEYVVQSATNYLIDAYFTGLEHLFSNKQAVSNSLLMLKLKEIIHLLLQSENPEPVKNIIKSLFSEKTFSFKEVVDAHLYKPISIENLSRLTGDSLSTFKRKFKEIYHVSPGQYILQKRLDKVAELLRISDDPVSQIGYDLGFESPEHLSRVFKKQFGITPSSYRAKQTV